MKFAVNAPQSVTLVTPGEDDADIRINFSMNGADSSRCKMQVIFPTGEMHELTFNTGGTLVDSHYIVPTDENNLDRTAEPNAMSHIVDGRDTRAFNPFTYEAPVTDDQKSREGLTPGFTQPVQTDEQRAAAEQAKAEAAERAKEAMDDLQKKAQETAEEREARRKEEEDKAWEERKRLQEAAASPDTGVTQGTATAETFPSQKTQDLVEGKKMDGTPSNEAEVQSDPNKPDYNPMAPAPSSPQPGSPPPHPLDQPDPGKVTTSSDLAGEPSGTSAEQERVKAEQDVQAANEAKAHETAQEKAAYDTEDAARDNSKDPVGDARRAQSEEQKAPA